MTIPHPSMIRSAAVAVLMVSVWWVTVAPSALGGPLTAIIVRGSSMAPGIQAGDLVLTHASFGFGSGSVVGFRLEDNVVVHRLEDRTDAGWGTRGDALRSDDPWRVEHDDVLGPVVARMPMGGWLIGSAAGPIALGGMAALVVVHAVAAASDERFVSIEGFTLRHRRSLTVAAGVMLAVATAAAIAEAALLSVATGGVASWSSSLTPTDVALGIHLP